MTIKYCACTQVKSLEKYVTDLVSSFDYSDFSPGNNGNSNDGLRAKFESVFINETPQPYWEQWERKHHSGYFIKFKKYGNNRKEV